MSSVFRWRLSVSVCVICVSVALLASYTQPERREYPLAADGISVKHTASALRLPPRDATFDYQLGGAYPPPTGATVIARDRTDPPAGAGYDICYVNGFQTQPDDSASFARQHPDLVVRINGKPLVDEGWPDEYIFDTSTESKRSALAAIVTPWIEGCKADGFSAVEIDNLDSYTRSRGALTADNNIALAAMYVQAAHKAELAIAQKNTADQTARLRQLGYDFAITESCFTFSECSEYTQQYSVVLDIEYTDELGKSAFSAACKSSDRAPLMIMRDHDLTTPDSSEYFYRSCPA